MRVLVVNAGSSTLKLQVIGADDDVDVDAHLDHWDGEIDAADLRRLLRGVAQVEAVGHRVVHGGRDLRAAAIVTPEVETAIDAATPLAPLHQQRAVVALAAARRALPHLPHVACFDTAFHASMPLTARTYALPRRWRDLWGLERFGFHGLSHAWAATRGADVTGVSRDARIVTCHLGAGASVCAVVGGRSVDTTMGFTPMDGIVMATRSGAVDPGLVLWLLTDAHLTAREVTEALEREAGLAGIAGTDDMRVVLDRRASGDADGALAFDVYIHRLRQGIAAMATSAGGLDLLVFTGGVGEHSAAVRAAAAEGLAMLGVALDRAANEAAAGDVDISARGTGARTAVVVSREDLEIARQVRVLLDRTR